MWYGISAEDTNVQVHTIFKNFFFWGVGGGGVMLCRVKVKSEQIIMNGLKTNDQLNRTKHITDI